MHTSVAEKTAVKQRLRRRSVVGVVCMAQRETHGRRGEHFVSNVAVDSLDRVNGTSNDENNYRLVYIVQQRKKKPWHM